MSKLYLPKVIREEAQPSLPNAGWEQEYSQRTPLPSATVTVTNQGKEGLWYFAVSV